MFSSDWVKRRVLDLTLYLLFLAFLLETAQPKQLSQIGLRNEDNDNHFGRIPFKLMESKSPKNYVIFTIHTPNVDAPEAFDHAFYLPLTALAWERIGFVSFVVIIGSRCEWENDPVLRIVLSHLEEMQSIVSFLPAPLEKRIFLSQLARIFGANMNDFPGRPQDFLITSSAPQWPLTRDFFILPPGNKKLLFSYHKYPTINIGATVSTWKEIMNDGHFVAKDSDEIMKYYEDEYGPLIRNPVEQTSSDWFYGYDHKLFSIRFADWVERHGNDSVIWGTDELRGEIFSRIDRDKWTGVSNLTKPQFELKYDAHLVPKLFRPKVWKETAAPLIELMFGRQSTEQEWAESYASKIYEKTKKLLIFY